MSLSTSIAVIEGLFSKGGVFIRTPKLNLESNKPRKKIDRAYVEPLSSLVWVEIALGLYALVTGIVLASWGMTPWMILYMLGFFYIAGLNLIQHRPQTGD
jgi:fatty acid desaturase